MVVTSVDNFAFTEILIKPLEYKISNVNEIVTFLTPYCFNDKDLSARKYVELQGYVSFRAGCLLNEKVKRLLPISASNARTMSL